MPTRYGSPDATIRTPPHRQPPVNRSMMRLLASSGGPWLQRTEPPLQTPGFLIGRRDDVDARAILDAGRPERPFHPRRARALRPFVSPASRALPLEAEHV